MGRPITRRQLEVLRAFQQLQLEQGLAPTLEELGQSLGVNRVTVYGHIQSLTQKGYLENLFPGASRGLDITELGHQALPKIQTEISTVPSENAIHKRAVEVSPHLAPEPTLPLLGKIAAGRPMEALENPTDVPLRDLLPSGDGFYLLEVAGDSMIDAQIASGDMVLVDQQRQPNSQDIVVAILEDQVATLKRYVPNPDGSTYLVPANKALEPIHVPKGHLEIRGVVTGVVRQY